MKLRFNEKLLLIVCSFACLGPLYCAKYSKAPIPPSCGQLVLVVIDSVRDASGTLYRFERTKTQRDWSPAGVPFPVVLGRNGLGWGDGLHTVPDNSSMPVKKEGDGRSPAGLFTLSAVFGDKPSSQMTEIAMPYIPVTEMVECVDDIDSYFYNRIVAKDTIAAEKVDWLSSERMYFARSYYALGVVVDHNRNPITRAHGSCIFLHNWVAPNETTSGCTAMAPAHMRELVHWLKKSENPLLLQLTGQLYAALKTQWKLPEVATP